MKNSKDDQSILYMQIQWLSSSAEDHEQVGCADPASIGTYPFLLALAQSNTLCMAVTPSLPRGTMSPPVITA